MNVRLTWTWPLLVAACLLSADRASAQEPAPTFDTNAINATSNSGPTANDAGELQRRLEDQLDAVERGMRRRARIEMHFVRKVCEPTEEQSAALEAEARWPGCRHRELQAVGSLSTLACARALLGTEERP